MAANASIDPSYVPPRASSPAHQMAVYDLLPRSIRDLMKSAPIDVDALSIGEELVRLRGNVAALEAMLRRECEGPLPPPANWQGDASRP